MGAGPERHKSSRIGWLRASVMGANDGIVSTASLIVGVASASADPHQILVAGIAGMVAGAMSMAAGEYVSVSSQSDTENADLAREKKELETDIEAELQELATIYEKRGLDKDLAMKVALKLHEHDALGAHARDELGISEITSARPFQAAWASAGTFAVGAALPLCAVIFAPADLLIRVTVFSSLISLAILGALAARTGGASPVKGALRVTFWGMLAMALTFAVGKLFNTQVS